MMKLWHADIRLPNGFVAPTHRIELRWSAHADAARLNDRYGIIPRLRSVTLGRLRVIEVGTENGKVVKIVVRGRLDDTHDLTLVLAPRNRGAWTVITAWKNERNDTHGTLDKSRYQR